MVIKERLKNQSPRFVRNTSHIPQSHRSTLYSSDRGEPVSGCIPLIARETPPVLRIILNVHNLCFLRFPREPLIKGTFQASVMITNQTLVLCISSLAFALAAKNLSSHPNLTLCVWLPLHPPLYLLEFQFHRGIFLHQSLVVSSQIFLAGSFPQFRRGL